MLQVSSVVENGPTVD